MGKGNSKANHYLAYRLCFRELGLYAWLCSRWCGLDKALSLSLPISIMGVSSAHRSWSLWIKEVADEMLQVRVAVGAFPKLFSVTPSYMLTK